MHPLVKKVCFFIPKSKSRFKTNSKKIKNIPNISKKLDYEHQKVTVNTIEENFQIPCYKNRAFVTENNNCLSKDVKN